MLLKFERWEEILEGDLLHWDPANPMERANRNYARARALIALDRLDEAEEEVASLRPKKAPRRRGPGGPGGPDGAAPDDAPDGPPPAFLAERNAGMLQELEALLLIARGEHLAGLGLLAEAAERQEESWQNDPPHDARFLYNALGDAYLELGAPRLAVDCYERTLETVFHDGFALAGLVVAHHRLGDEDAARAAMARLKVVWSDADPNRWLMAAEATGVVAEPHLDAPAEQRNYRREVLDVLGPSAYVRASAPELLATAADGRSVALSDYDGKNVLLIFYLGEQCVHCIEQLTLAQERIDALQDLDTVVLAVSKDTVEAIAAQADDFDLVLLSDPEFENARRFRSFDDFEEIELHSTFLIDREGRVHWSRIGGEPFTDFDYLERELARMNGEPGRRVTAKRPGPSGPGSD